MKIAAAQISCAPGDLEANLRKVREFTSRAKSAGAEVIVFPEMTDTGYSMSMIQEHATSWKEGAVPSLQTIARELSIAIVSGVSERDGASIYNAQVFVDGKGEIVAKYRKTHLVTAAPLDERPYFTPGDAFASYKSAIRTDSSGGEIDKFNFGLSICYDLRFPEMCRTLVVKHGVNVIVNSSAWPFPRVEHLRILALARAIENQSYLILANRVGTDDGVTLCGTSAIIDPYGAILAAASVDREELLQAEISADVIDSVRNRMAAFAHRRPELYKL
jgi:predicted amidohydrolase